MLQLAALVVLSGVRCLHAHSQEDDPGGTVPLVAAPRLVDPDYRGAVLLAVPVENNRHVGVIINRPTGRSLARLFPEHAPSKLVRDTVYCGGLLGRSVVFGVVAVGDSAGACHVVVEGYSALVTHTT